MLIWSMAVSADGFVADCDGGIDWTAPSDALFDVHLERVQHLGGEILGRRLYETMLVWETDPALRSSPSFTAFADAWTALPKVVFSRGDVVLHGHARRASAPLVDEVRAMLDASDRDIEIGGADLAGQAFAQGLVGEVNLFRSPVVLGDGRPFFPASDRPTALALLETRAFDDGVVLERYRPVATR